MAGTLNRDSPPTGGEQPLAIPEPQQRPPISSRQPASILLVDDDESSLRALTHVLEPLGQHLVTARSGEEALHSLLREDFALILLDMYMPGLDGLQTARYINARARTRHIPIIFLTAHDGDVELVFDAHSAGAVDYVAKPFEPDVLRSKVAVFVELHQARAEHIREARARAEAEGIASTVSKLQSISDAALAHLELQELLPELLKRAAAVFAADASGLLLRADDDRSLTVFTPAGVQRFSDEAQLALIEKALSPALGGTALDQEQLAALEPLLGTPADQGMRSLIAAPLVATREPLGTLFLASREPRRFTDEDMVVLKLGAERAAIALEHARSYERERWLVEVLQDHLLPDQLPRVPGLAMAARYRPSERLAEVGGDWYDAIMLPDRRVGLVIGDVVGHGIGAATMMAELRAALRAYAMVQPESPGAAITSLNALVASTHRRMVATLLYMVVEPEGAGVRFASAGHLPPLLMNADGQASFLAQHVGTPLGVEDHIRYEDFETDFEPGSTLLLYTDGLVERRGEVIDAGLTRLSRSLTSAPHELEALCGHVLQSAYDGAPGVHDDTALVAVRRLERTTNLLDVTLPAEPDSVADARHRLSGWLVGRGVAPDDVFDITLAAGEACNNAVEHAYGPEEGAMFRLLGECSPSAITLHVSDGGSWRDPRGSERGRGLRLIAQLMDHMNVRRTTDGTTVQMTKRWMDDGRP
jgi:serine phosphatase RsbU (regulator of sigma subunit)/DNA-binding response OmpR family regulator/anti-sigma regulatory factor (Ser/Thr protein kinase)